MHITDWNGGLVTLMHKFNIQAFGCALTYCRRYALKSILGVNDGQEDDDGEQAVRAPQPAAKPAPKVEPAKAKPVEVKPAPAKAQPHIAEAVPEPEPTPEQAASEDEDETVTTPTVERMRAVALERKFTGPALYGMVGDYSHGRTKRPSEMTEREATTMLAAIARMTDGEVAETCRAAKAKG
jgi:hypothetical protein